MPSCLSWWGRNQGLGFASGPSLVDPSTDRCIRGASVGCPLKVTSLSTFQPLTLAPFSFSCLPSIISCLFSALFHCLLSLPQYRRPGMICLGLGRHHAGSACFCRLSVFSYISSHEKSSLCLSVFLPFILWNIRYLASQIFLDKVDETGEGVSGSLVNVPME